MGLKVELFRVGGGGALLATIETNRDGRGEKPLLEGSALTVGTYELRFHAGEYLRRSGAQLTYPPFLDVIPIRFGIGSPDEHYHVPLLLSPYGYSTYRGS